MRVRGDTRVVLESKSDYLLLIVIRYNYSISIYSTAPARTNNKLGGHFFFFIYRRYQTIPYYNTTHSVVAICAPISPNINLLTKKKKKTGSIRIEKIVSFYRGKKIIEVRVSLVDFAFAV